MPGKVARLAPDATAEEVKQAMVHDVNNALTGIYGGLDMAEATLAGTGSPRLLEDLAQIREAADRLLTLSRQVEQSLATGPCPPGQHRVLVVEDDPNILELIESALGGHACVVRAGSGGQALAQLVSGAPFDAILTDLHLPDTDAPQLIRAVYELSPALAERVIIMTGGATSARHERFLADRAGPVLYKPFAIATLRGVVASVTTRG